MAKMWNIDELNGNFLSAFWTLHEWCRAIPCSSWHQDSRGLHRRFTSVHSLCVYTCDAQLYAVRYLAQAPPHYHMCAVCKCVVQIGRNYADHAKEMGDTAKLSEPIFFLKPPSRCGHELWQSYLLQAAAAGHSSLAALKRYFQVPTSK